MHERGGTERIETVVIGGGQAGLSAGYHLARRGLPFVILDADTRIGDHWRDRWDSLQLYSPARYDGLPGMRFPAANYHYPTAREMGDYLEAYAARLDLPVRSGITVERVRPRPDGGYDVQAGDLQIEAAQVVVATGPFRIPSIPDFAGGLDPEIRQLHSNEYRNPSQLKDGPVLVVGLSHSGADLALEAAKNHLTHLSGRAHGELPIAVIDRWRAHLLMPLVNFAFNHVLTMRTPMGRKMATEIRKGGGPLLRVRRIDLTKAGVDLSEARTVGVRDGRPVLADGTVLDVTNVIWCTGFRLDYDWIEVDGIVDADGWPNHVRGVVQRAPGLYFLGVPFTYSFSSMLVNGAGRDAAFVVDRIVDRLEGRASANKVSSGRQIALG